MNKHNTSAYVFQEHLNIKVLELWLERENLSGLRDEALNK